MSNNDLKDIETGPVEESLNTKMEERIEESEKEFPTSSANGTSKSQYIVFVLFVYSVVSILMTTSNKEMLRLIPGFPMFCLLYQYTATSAGISLLILLKLRPAIKFSWSRLLEAIPANMFFLVMLMSSNFSLALLSIPMVTVLKNFTTVCITVGDALVLRKPVEVQVWVSLGIMIISSFIAVAFDLEFNAAGYSWMAVNILAQTCHVLFRYRMGEKMSLDETQLYVNVIGILFMMPIVMYLEPTSFAMIMSSTPRVWMMMLLNGVLSIVIGYASQWALGICGATVFSYAGSINKLPLVILSWFIFPSVITTRGVISVCVAIFSAVIFVAGKR